MKKINMLTQEIINEWIRPEQIESGVITMTFPYFEMILKLMVIKSRTLSTDEVYDV